MNRLKEDPALPPPEAPPPANPFVGPQPLENGQPLHGRRRETEELSNLIVGKRIVLLFSPSGAGKTSLIRAGLLPKLEGNYEMQALPIVRLGYRDPEYQDDPAVNRYRLATLSALEAMRPLQDRRRTRALRDYSLRSYFDSCVVDALQRDEEGLPKFPLLILDQLEELFFDPLDVDKKREFLAELGELLAEPPAGKHDGTRLAIWALFAVREDRLAELQPYLGLIPTALSFRYRLEALGVEAACEVIRETGKAWIADDVPEQIVADLCTVSVRGVDGKERLEQGPVVEPVHLQIVCRDLWDRIVAKEGRAITSTDLVGQSYGSVNRALGDFYDRAVAAAVAGTAVQERHVREWLEAELISPTGVRTQSLPEASTFKDDRVIRSLVDAHVLRLDKRSGRDWVELPHDRLVTPIREANLAWATRHLHAFQFRARRWQAAETDTLRQSLLLDEAELDEAQRYAKQHRPAVTDKERAFLADSEAGLAASRRARRNKRIGRWTIAGVVSLAIFGLSAWAWDERGEKEQAQARTRIYGVVSKSRELGPAEALDDLLPELTLAANAKDNGVLSHTVDNGIRQALARAPAALERELQPRRHLVWSLAFSDDGQRLFAGSWDGHLTVQDVTRPDPVLFVTPDLHSSTYAVAVHDATGLVVSTHWDGHVRIWHWDGNALQLQAEFYSPKPPRERIPGVALSDDGRWLATGGWNKWIDIWDLARPQSPRHVTSFRHGDTVIQSMALIPGLDASHQQRLVSTDYNGYIRLWAIGPDMPADPQPLRSFAIRDHAGVDVGVSASAVSPDGRYLVAGDTTGTLHLWDLASPDGPGVALAQATHVGSAQDKQVKDIAFAADSKSFASVGFDGNLVRWTFPDAAEDLNQLATGITVQRFRPGGRLFSVAYRPHAKNQVAVGGTRAIYLLDLDRGTGPALSRPLSVAGGQQAWRSVSVDAGGDLVAERDRTGIRFWRKGPAGFRPVPEWSLTQVGAAAFALAPTGATLVTADCTGQPTSWRLSAGAAPSRSDGTTPWPADCERRPARLALSHDGRWLATADRNRLRLWERGSGEPERWREIATQPLWGAAGNGGQAQKDAIWTLAFSADARYLGVGTETGTIYLWHMGDATRRPGLVPGKLVDIGTRVNALAFNPDGASLRAGGDDGYITEYSVPGLKAGNVASRHERAITGLAFAPVQHGAARWISSDQDGYLVEWTPRPDDRARMSAVELAPRGSPPISAIAMSRDGSLLVTAGTNPTAYDLSPANVLATAQAYAQRRYVDPEERKK